MKTDSKMNRKIKSVDELINRMWSALSGRPVEEITQIWKEWELRSGPPSQDFPPKCFLK